MLMYIVLNRKIFFNWKLLLLLLLYYHKKDFRFVITIVKYIDHR